MKKLLVFVVLITVLALTGCGPDYETEGTVSSTQEVAVSYVEKIPGKLYFIPHDDGKADFPAKYDSFLKANPNLRPFSVTEVRSEDTNASDTLGYFVFTESK